MGKWILLGGAAFAAYWFLIRKPTTQRAQMVVDPRKFRLMGV